MCRRWDSAVFKMAAGDEVSGRDGQMGDDGNGSLPTLRSAIGPGGREYSTPRK